MMRKSLHSLFLLLRTLTIVVMVQAQDQSGFISLDCGLPEKSSYTEDTIGINYISDANFIETGVSMSVSPEDKATHQKQLGYLRSFPNGARNCYKINVASATKYLIRANFLYGNYDGLNELPQFDLHLGANFWETVKLTNSSWSYTTEIIHTPSLDYVHICLVNTGKGTPFISAIELRMLDNKTYDAQSSGSLARFLRLDLGSITNLTYRYKDDVYDRLWDPLNLKQWKQLSSTLTNDELSQNHYKPPAVVMSTAAAPANSSASLDLMWEPNNVDEQYYVYMHFNEVQKLAANQTRSFNITMNGKFWFGPLVPAYQSTTTIYSPSAVTGATNYTVSLFRTEKSSLPPIVNAIEIYLVKDFSQLETHQDDVAAISNIKDSYNVARNWQGDPCAPIAYMWEGLNCSFEGKSSPRITSLDLSSSELTGQISSYISKLTMLQYLDLSNNSLSGSIPYFLTQLQSLKFLYKAAVNIHMKPKYPNEPPIKAKQQQYSFNELVNITNNFERLLGEGGFGKVYYGIIDDTEVAVKILSATSEHVYQQFLAEVKHMMKVHHKNLTSLIGYCNEEKNKALIYEYMANGDLDEHLLGKKSNPKFLTWEDRLRIAVDAAQGLEYLHHGCKPLIIHRDVKCANILLTENFQAKLADFGLSRSFLADGDTHISTAIVAGTLGYLDPQCTMLNRFTEKSDVYSFGVVLLKIITGQPAISKTEDKVHISHRVDSLLSKGDIEGIVDSELQGDFDSSSVWKAVEIAMASVSYSPDKRPYMSDVLVVLKECLAIELARKQSNIDTENTDLIEFTYNLTSETGPLVR
ncbi:LRR receptor-like serine/threonine-protein kinase IOS1 [Arachis stenosperma]|uniref:LRR receptor-like serine/threonine-protein kinase IOS1 n=1 Tax=Arachis stenosperma TaxID=217475 RepID=UPI0025AC388F|nr:LRR receptor-like serine/threonine-protein kinase IOS1 [Arachis stenosperma]